MDPHDLVQHQTCQANNGYTKYYAEHRTDVKTTPEPIAQLTTQAAWSPESMIEEPGTEPAHTTEK